MPQQFWIRVFDCGMATPPLHRDVLSFYWRWALQVPSPHCRAFHLRSLPLSPESLSLPRSLVHPRGSPTSHLPRLPVSILSAGPQGFSPVLLHSRPPISDHVPLFPSLSPFHPRSLSPFPTPLIAFFSFPSGMEASSHHGPFGFLAFLSSVDCILGILYIFG